MSVDPSSPIPIYRQIVDYIQRAVAAGVYRQGEMLPSVRALAQALQVNPNTVQRAYEALERARLIYARKGLGMFVTTEGVQSAQRSSRAAVLDMFAQGVRAARAARMSPESIREVFEVAWRSVAAETRVDL